MLKLDWYIVSSCIGILCQDLYVVYSVIIISCVFFILVKLWAYCIIF